MNHIFISYKRAAKTTPVAEQLYRRLKLTLGAKEGFDEPFLDRQSIEAGNAWSETLELELARTTHFIALLSVDYWFSAQCQRELSTAFANWQAKGDPVLLFVLTELMDTESMTVADDGRSAQLAKRFPQIDSLGQINFLGPYDKGGQLLRLACEDEATLGDQLHILVQDIKRHPRSQKKHAG